MSKDFATSLHADLQRMIPNLMDRIASDGLKALKATLDEAGVSERLGHCEIFSHVAGDTVIFEVVVDSDAVVASDAKTAAATQEEMSKAKKKMMKKVTKTFEMGLEGPRRAFVDARKFQMDARSSARDARSSARDARVSAKDARSSAEKRAGRADSGLDRHIDGVKGMNMTPSGKLSLTIERSMSVDKLGTHIPKSAFQGIMGDFMDRLNSAIHNNFADKLSVIMSRHVQ
jgi:hypothetical protein